MKSKDKAKCTGSYCRKPFTYLVSVKNPASLDPYVMHLCGWHAKSRIDKFPDEIIEVNRIIEAKEK